MSAVDVAPPLSSLQAPAPIKGDGLTASYRFLGLLPSLEMVQAKPGEGAISRHLAHSSARAGSRPHPPSGSRVERTWGEMVVLFSLPR